MKLLADLRSMIEAGLLIEVSEPGQPSRYALSDLGEQLTLLRSPDTPQPPRPRHEFSIDWPEPCPACGAREGFDGGGRCHRCRVAWPPEM